MDTHRIRDRVANLAAAAEALCDTGRLLELAVEAVAAACPRGKAFAFTRRSDGTHGAAAAWADGSAQSLRARRPDPPVPWIVNIDRVPLWQRDRWVEPMHAGVHGPDYFSTSHPIRRLLGPRMQPDYGRIMVCRGGRMVAWLGVYVDARRGFLSAERAALDGMSARLALPLRMAAALGNDNPCIALARRQHEIVSRVALGWSNKRIARDLEISPATVKTILERLFRTSGAGNRTALVEWWRRGT
jgi:DNA-binding CsgD family transcriptional regulator